MNAIPSLNGSIGYIYSTCDLDLKSSGDVRFKDVVERFRVHDVPKRPEGKEEEWLGGNRVDTRGESFVYQNANWFSCLRDRLFALWTPLHPNGPARRLLHLSMVRNDPGLCGMHTPPASSIHTRGTSTTAQFIGYDALKLAARHWPMGV